MKFLNITLATFLAIFLVSCDGSAKDNFSLQGTVWESQPKNDNSSLKFQRQSQIEFKTADTLIYSYNRVPGCGGEGKKDYAIIIEIKYTYDANKKEVKLVGENANMISTTHMQPTPGKLPPFILSCKPTGGKEVKITQAFAEDFSIKNLDKNSTQIEVITKTFDKNSQEDERMLLKK